MVGISKRHDDLSAAAKEAGLAVDVIAPGDAVPPPGGAGPVALRTGEAGAPLDGEQMEAALLYTSGTTGSPQGLHPDQHLFFWNAAAGTPPLAVCVRSVKTASE